MFQLIDDTAGKSWNYDTEPQLRTAARLYAIQHPHASLAVVIRGQRHQIR